MALDDGLKWLQIHMNIQHLVTHGCQGLEPEWGRLLTSLGYGSTVGLKRWGKVNLASSKAGRALEGSCFGEDRGARL